MRDDIPKMLSRAYVVPGFASTLDRLKRNHIRRVIISGGIDAFLHTMIPNWPDYFDQVFLNHFVFNKRGFLIAVEATPYDFEGKCRCIEVLAKQYNISEKRIAFVGEGLNDRHLTGKLGCTIGFLPESEEIRQGFDVLVEQEDFSALLSHLGL